MCLVTFRGSLDHHSYKVLAATYYSPLKKSISSEGGHSCRWASTSGEEHDYLIFPAQPACILSIGGLSSVLSVLCIHLLTKILCPIISLDQLFFRASWHDSFFMHILFIFLAHLECVNNKHSSKVHQNISWDITIFSIFEDHFIGGFYNLMFI